jgi:beta-N-acetylhexosaminidase
MLKRVGAGSTVCGSAVGSHGLDRALTGAPEGARHGDDARLKATASTAKLTRRGLLGAAAAAAAIVATRSSESQMLASFITALSGPELTPEEKAVLRATRPCGIILFARNIRLIDKVGDPAQVLRLTEAARDAVGHDILVLIDQEGGRVQRLMPPTWRDLPPAAAYGRLYAADPAGACRKARLAAQLTAMDLRAIGINTNCAPVLDVPAPGSHKIIGDRAYGVDVSQVAALGGAVAEGLMAGGVLPVIKHVPGHGRAAVDSHVKLPVVAASLADLQRIDFATFRACADMPAAMTAHVVYDAVDPAQPASTSPQVIGEVIRNGIGFDGLLMSDDLGMDALKGSTAERTCAVLAAGCDVALVCSGKLADTEAAASEAPPLSGASLVRYKRACAILQQRQELDVAGAEESLAQALRVEA